MPNFYILNVGHGNCSIVIDAERVTVIDAGPKSDLLDFLEKRKIFQIDAILISHADNDHLGGLLALIHSNFDIKEIFLNSDSTKDRMFWNDLVYSLYERDKYKTTVLNPSLTSDIEDKINTGSVKFEVLAPNKYFVVKGIGGNDLNGKKIASNSLSAVIRLSYKNHKLILIPGDLDDIGLNSLLTDHSEINAKVMIFPHHGGRPGNSDVGEFVKSFCNSSKPNYIIFSIRKNDYHFPRKDILKNILKYLPDVIMYTTSHSKSFENFNKKNNIAKNKNGVGTIKINFDSSPFKFEFIDFTIKPILKRGK